MKRFRPWPPQTRASSMQLPRRTQRFQLPVERVQAGVQRLLPPMLRTVAARAVSVRICCASAWPGKAMLYVFLHNILACSNARAGGILGDAFLPLSSASIGCWMAVR